MRFLIMLPALLLLAFSQPASAEIKTFKFDARIDQPNSIYATGTIFSGSFSYDEALTPIANYPSQTGLYSQYSDSSIMLSALISGNSYSTNGLAGVSDDLETLPDGIPGGDGDYFQIFNISGPVILSFDFNDPSGNIYGSTDLPLWFPKNLWQGPFIDPNDDDDLTVPNASFSFYDSSVDAGFDAIILNISAVNAVPEPSIWIMMVVGFGFIGSRLRSNSRHTRFLAA